MVLYETEIFEFEITINTNLNITMKDQVDTWNKERILQNYLLYSDAAGYLPKVDEVGKSIKR